MKIRIGNDIRLRVNVDIYSKSAKKVTTSSLLYTAALDYFPSNNFQSVEEHPSSAWRLYRTAYNIDNYSDISLQYTGKATRFHYIVSWYTKDAEDGTEDHSEITRVATGTLDDVKTALFTKYDSGVESSTQFPTAVIVWTDLVETGNTISVYGTSETYGTEAPLNIQSIKAYLINTTAAEKRINDLKNKIRFLGRFPVEPFLDEYIPNAYNINSSGHPKYHTLVANRYGGFGVYPKWKHIVPHPECDDDKFLAPVERTEESNVIDIIFPAQHQLHTGVYKLLLVVQLYDYGYKHNNVRTITTDYPEAFELVGSTAEADVDGLVQLDLRRITGADVTPNKQDADVYTYSGSYAGNYVTLNLTNGKNVDIDMSDIADWYEGD